MANQNSWGRFKDLVNQNPVKFVGVVQAILAFAVIVAATFGVIIPSALVAGFLGTLTVVLTWWTQNNKTTPVYNLYDADGVNEEDFDLPDPDVEDYVGVVNN